MKLRILHVYRNTPLGRETLMQAADFVKKTDGELHIYMPEYDRFLFNFGHDAVEIRLDKSYSYQRESAERNMQKVLDEMQVQAKRVQIAFHTASNLPRLFTNFDILSLPRVIVERQGKLQLAAIGTGVRQLIKNAHAPGLISPRRFHDWQDILVLFGGSRYAVIALQWGLTIAAQSGLPLHMLTLVEKKEEQQSYEELLSENRISLDRVEEWRIIEAASPHAVLDEIPRTSLIIMGAYGHGRIFAKLFGSKTELIQKNTANLLMLIGEHCRAPQSAR